MAEEVNTLRRNLELRPRPTGKRDPEELRRILARIYPKEVVTELMEKLCRADGERKDDT